MTAFAYSAIFLLRTSLEPSQSGCTASKGQAAMQRPQPTHLPWSLCALPALIEIALCAQFLAQRPQPMHLSSSMSGLPSLCISILPARDPEPMPRFLIAPPKPVSSCPLKWDSEMTISASAMITWQPVQNGL